MVSFSNAIESQGHRNTVFDVGNCICHQPYLQRFGGAQRPHEWSPWKTDARLCTVHVYAPYDTCGVPYDTWESGPGEKSIIKCIDLVVI